MHSEKPCLRGPGETITLLQVVPTPVVNAGVGVSPDRPNRNKDTKLGNTNQQLNEHLPRIQLICSTSDLV
jgi:hypothetical protein